MMLLGIRNIVTMYTEVRFVKHEIGYFLELDSGISRVRGTHHQLLNIPKPSSDLERKLTSVYGPRIRVIAL
jgi:hypothetical protein